MEESNASLDIPSENFQGLESSQCLIQKTVDDDQSVENAEERLRRKRTINYLENDSDSYSDDKDLQKLKKSNKRKRESSDKMSNELLVNGEKNMLEYTLKNSKVTPKKKMIESNSERNILNDVKFEDDNFLEENTEIGIIKEIKKKSGRPRKDSKLISEKIYLYNFHEGNGDILEENSVDNRKMEENATFPIIRKCGRPRKIITQEKELMCDEIGKNSETDINKDINIVSLPKRKFGRPHKIKFDGTQSNMGNEEQRHFRENAQLRMKRSRLTALSLKDFSTGDMKDEYDNNDEFEVRNINTIGILKRKYIKRMDGMGKRVRNIKKRLGRPPKNFIKPAPVILRDSDGNIILKRRQGRPRKNLIIENQQNVNLDRSMIRDDVLQGNHEQMLEKKSSNIEGEESEKPKRKYIKKNSYMNDGESIDKKERPVGRPPKNDLTKEGEKRDRGRPRKSLSLKYENYIVENQSDESSIQNTKRKYKKRISKVLSLESNEDSENIKNKNQSQKSLNDDIDENQSEKSFIKSIPQQVIEKSPKLLTKKSLKILKDTVKIPTKNDMKSPTKTKKVMPENSLIKKSSENITVEKKSNKSKVTSKKIPHMETKAKSVIDIMKAEARRASLDKLANLEALYSKLEQEHENTKKLLRMTEIKQGENKD